MEKKYFKALIRKTLDNTGLIKYSKNISWLVLERLLRMLVGLFVNIWLARYLAPTQYGLLNYAQSFVYLFAIFATLGLDSVVVRELVENKYEKNIILGTSLTLKLIASFIMFPLLYLFIYALGINDYASTLIYIIAFSSIFQSFSVIDSYYQSLVQSKYIVIVNIIAMLLSSIMKIILILISAPLIAFAIAYTIDAAILMALLVLMYIKNTGTKVIIWRFDFSFSKYLIKEAWPMWLSGILIAIYAKTDQLMIQEMLGSEDVGLYVSAVKLNDILSFIPAIICASVFPAIINAHSVSKIIYMKRINYLYSLMIWLSLFIALASYILAPYIFKFTFGNEYLKSIDTFKMLVWSNIFVFFLTAWAKYVMVEKKQKYLLYFDILAVIINIGLNLILIPAYGIYGAAIATVLAVPLSQIIIFILWKDQRYIMQSFIKSFFLRF